MNFFNKIGIGNFFSAKEKTVKLEDRVYECPYCFKELRANDVHFRKNRGDEIVDSALTQFYIDTELLDIGEKEYAKPWVDPKAEKFSDQYSLEKKDSVYHSVTDKLSQETTYQKLCPHCHMDLPEIFGRANLLKISFCGPTSVGKTMYMSRLFDVFADNISQNYDYSFLPLGGGEAIGQHLSQVQQSSKRLAAATNRIYHKPIFYDLNAGEKGRYLCAIYDIAGEDSVDVNITNTYTGKRLNYSDGILLLLHPDMAESIDQDDNLNLSLGKENKKAVAAISQIDNRIKQGKTIKLATIINKSDILRTILSSEEQNGEYNLFFKDNDGLDDHDLNEINRLSQKYLTRFDKQLVVGLNNLTNFAPHFFAVSTLGSNEITETNELKYQVTSTRLTEPFFWLLRENGIDLTKPTNISGGS